VVESGVVLYRLGWETLPEQQGGPFRFLITDAQACAQVELISVPM